jgi:hypothetical protein
MLEFCQQEQRRGAPVSVIACWHTNRFSRADSQETAWFIWEYRKAGVGRIFTAQRWYDLSRKEDRALLNLEQDFTNQQYSIDLSQASARGMAKKAREGGWLGGKAPYGYRLTTDKRLVLGDPEEVEAVRWMFDTYANTCTSLGELVRLLNERGVPSPGEVERRTGKHRGRPEGLLWCKTAVHKILTRPVYLGHTVWNRRHEGAYHGVTGAGEVVPSWKPKKAVKPNDPSEWIVYEGTHEALVDQDTFDRVQRRLVENRDHCAPKSKGRVYLFTGLMRCGHCGWPMHGCALTYGYKDKRYSYQRYVCGNYNLHGATACQCNTVLEDVVFRVLCRKLEQAFSAPDRMALLEGELRRRVEARADTAEGGTKELDGRIAELGRRIDQGTERWLTAPPALMDEIGKKLQDWKEERDRLAERRRQAARPRPAASDVEATVERIAGLMRQLVEHGHKAGPAAKKTLVREMVERIDLRFEHVPYGKQRSKSVLVGGKITLRDALLVSSPVFCASPDTTVYPARTSSVASRSATRRP